MFDKIMNLHNLFKHNDISTIVNACFNKFLNENFKAFVNACLNTC